jgi:hypothetical protein
MKIDLCTPPHPEVMARKIQAVARVRTLPEAIAAYCRNTQPGERQRSIVISHLSQAYILPKESMQ